ncbi:MAG: DUF4332 domain-containing protein [Candidatus Bathyarchaeota archaeon]|nr:MAG: DUF4332 domain-containing protein [Candidatus Bathyarchaeota archaeon]
MTSKRALKVWVLIVFAFLAALGTFHAWISWQFENASTVTLFIISVEIVTYFTAMLGTTFLFLGAVCFVVFQGESTDLPVYQLGKDFEEKLGMQSEEIKASTDEALTKLGLREFQLKETMQELQKELKEIDSKLKENLATHDKALRLTKKKLMDVERKVEGIGILQKELKLKKKLQTIEHVDKNVSIIQRKIAKIDSIADPSVASTDDIKVLKGKVLKLDTIRQLRKKGIQKVEDLLLKNPLEIALTGAMSEGEAKSLQSVTELLMIPGIQHQDAVLLLKSGVNSRQELALQDALTLGARVSKVAELYVEEGKIKDNKKPTLEKVASWIKQAKSY